jgi:hypothetical protein
MVVGPNPWGPGSMRMELKNRVGESNAADKSVRPTVYAACPALTGCASAPSVRV